MRWAERVVGTRWLRQRAGELVEKKADCSQRLKPAVSGHPGRGNAACERVVLLRVAGRSVSYSSGLDACRLYSARRLWALAGQCVLAPGGVAPSAGIAGWESCCWRPKRQEGSHSAGSFPATAPTGWSCVPRRAVGSCSRLSWCPGEHPQCYARSQLPPVHAGWRCSKRFGRHPVSSLYARLSKSRLRLPASIAGNVPPRLLLSRSRCWMFFIVIHAAGTVPVDTDQHELAERFKHSRPQH